MPTKTTKIKEKNLVRQAKEAVLNQPITLSEDAPFAENFNTLLERLAEKYEGWTLEQLETALSEVRVELQQVNSDLSATDDALNEAAALDAVEYATAGDLAEVEGSNFVRAQRKAAGAVIKAWSLNRAITEIDLAWRVKRTAELEAEIREVGEKVPGLEEKARKAQDALNEARWYHTDLINEARDVRVNKRHVGEWSRLSQGPNLGGWLNFMMRSR